MYNISSSQKTDSLETRAALIEIFMLCWNLPSCQKHRGWLQKNSAYPERNKHFCRWFCANLDRTKADMVQFTDGTRNGLSNIKETFAEELQLKMLVLCAKVWALSKRLVSQFHMIAGRNKCKEKVPDMPASNQNVETTCNSKLKFA